jgi:hypothetical protein
VKLSGRGLVDVHVVTADLDDLIARDDALGIRLDRLGQHGLDGDGVPRGRGGGATGLQHLTAGQAFLKQISHR